MPALETLEANHLRFAYFAEGTGPLVLLLHGFPDTAHTWDDLRPKLAANGFRAVSPFMRGYHPTEVPDEDAEAETLAQDVLGLITALGEQQAIVVGHDFGALAAYGAAALGAARVSKLVTIAIPHPASLSAARVNLWRARHFLAYKLPGAARRFARNDFAALPEICRRWSPTWHCTDADLAAVRESFSVPASLNAAFGYYRRLSPRPPRFLRVPIEVPTVVFAGTDDPLIRPAEYRRAAPLFRKKYLVEELPGGHFLHRESPDEFADRLLVHLRASA